MHRKAFTLVEMLVVVSIIGLLAAVIVSMVGSSRAKGRDAKRVADINLLSQKIQAEYTEDHSYPNATSYDGLLTALDFDIHDPNSPTIEYNYTCLGNRTPDDITTECTAFKLFADLEKNSTPYCVGYDIYGADKCQ